MRRFTAVIVSILLLGIVGVACLMAGRFERRMAIAEEDMAVLDFVDPEAEYARLEQEIAGIPLVSDSALKDIRRRRAMLQYWQRDYTDLIEVARQATAGDNADAVDPEMRVLAANALYRVAQRGPQDRAMLLKNLDAAIRAYNEALRAASSARRGVQLRARRATARRNRRRQAEGPDERQNRRHRERSEHARRSGRASEGHEGGAVPDSDSDGPERDQAKSGRSRRNRRGPAKTGLGS
jgi:hypothetical protein